MSLLAALTEDDCYNDPIVAQEMYLRELHGTLLDRRSNPIVEEKELRKIENENPEMFVGGLSLDALANYAAGGQETDVKLRLFFGLTNLEDIGVCAIMTTKMWNGWIGDFFEELGYESTKGAKGPRIKAVRKYLNTD